MGYYIETIQNGESLGTFFTEKSEKLISDGAIEIKQPTEFKENLVCVIDNGFFAAAGYCFSPQEFAEFAAISGREKRWFIYTEAEELSGYKNN
jgi:hypothetical protein